MDKYSLTFDEACKFIGVSPPTLRGWIRSGRIVATRKAPQKKQSPYMLTRQNGIATLNNSIQAIDVSAVDAKEGKKCQYSAGATLGTLTSQSRAVKELNNLLRQRTESRRRSCTTN